jgi:peptidoglycan hydrolase-like protein with peptidoglycan-binding domain
MTKNINRAKFTLGVMTAFAIVATSLTYAAPLYRDLYVGIRGSDVGDLQTFLKADPNIYPQGLVTNYFGGMTKSAVINFQVKNGISAIGRVGPQTRGVINNQMANGVGSNTGNSGNAGVAPNISGINLSTNGNLNSVNISWTTNELAQGMIYYSASPLSLYENENSVTVTGASTASTNNNFTLTQNVLVQNLQSNTTYYYLIYTTDQSGNVSVFSSSSFRIN